MASCCAICRPVLDRYHQIAEVELFVAEVTAQTDSSAAWPCQLGNYASIGDSAYPLCTYATLNQRDVLHQSRGMTARSLLVCFVRYKNVRHSVG